MTRREKEILLEYWFNSRDEIKSIIKKLKKSIDDINDSYRFGYTPDLDEKREYLTMLLGIAESLQIRNDLLMEDMIKAQKNQQ